MATTTESLTDTELAAMRQAAATFTAPAGYYRGMDPRGYVEFFLHTGCHPIVLARPNHYDLKWEAKADRTLVSWLRPKKHGAAARSSMVLGPDYVFLRDFVDGVRSSPKSDRQIALLIAAIASAAGIRGKVSPRTLRHTCGVLMLRRSRNPQVVQEKLNVGDRVLRDYLRLTNEESDKAVDGFLPPIGGPE